MKIKLLTTMLLGIPVFAHSQVSLNASMAPPVNTTIIYNDANVPNPPFIFGKSGTNNTWDFASITAWPGAEDTTYVISPSAIPLGSAFPSATHCTYEDGTGTSYTMMQINSSGINFLGSVSDLSGSGNYMAVVANPPLVAMAFPYTYGSSGNGTSVVQIFTTGAAIGQPSVDSVHYKSTITGQRDVIAAGNMILPSGTLPAMLERSINSSIDTLWMKGAITLNQWIIAPNFPQTSLDSSFYWYTNQSLLPYAHALYDNTGLHDVNFYKATISGIAEHENSLSANVYPNPVTDVLHLNIAENFQGNHEISIYNSCGQLVMKATNWLDQINVSHLHPGIYFMRLNDSSGRNVSLRFIKS